MIIGLQYLRGLAALLVVHSHLYNEAVSISFSWLRFGSFGVDIFFVISGFVMWRTTADVDAKFLPFLKKRTARIVPLYWFFTLALVGLGLIAPRLVPNVDLSWNSVVSSLLFLPYHQFGVGDLKPIVRQGWSLNYEAFFYIVFAFSLFVKNTSYRLMLVVGTLLAIVFSGTLFDHNSAAFIVYSDERMLEFVLGIFVAIAYRNDSLLHGARKFGVYILALAVVASVFASALFDIEEGIVLFGIPSALLLFVVLSFESRLEKRPIAFFKFSGDASYSIYLCHFFAIKPVAILFSYLASRVDLLKGSFVLFSVYVVVAFASVMFFSWASYFYVERPLIGLFRRKKVVAQCVSA